VNTLQHSSARSLSAGTADKIRSRFGIFLRTARALLLPALVLGLAQNSTAETVRVGLTVPLTGVQAGLGKEAETVWRAVARQFNGTAALKGRDLEIVVIDDAYDPAKSKANTEALVAQNVAFMAASAGVPNIQAMMPVLELARVPLIGPASGSLALRGKSPALFHVKASFGAEVEHMAELLSTMGLKRVAVLVDDAPDREPLVQRFSDGLARMSGGKSGLLSKQVLPQKGGNTAQAVSALLAKQPDVVYVMTIPGLAGSALKEFRAQGFKGFVTAWALTATDSVVREAGPAGDGVIFGAVMLSPTSTKPGIQSSFQDFVRKQGVKPSFRAMEIYVTGRIIIEALARIDSGPVTGNKVWSSLETLRDLNIDGWRVTFTPTDHDGGRFVDSVMLMPDGRFR
jgi:branched-chain amino acid transport system substrate-binding protein